MSSFFAFSRKLCVRFVHCGTWKCESFAISCHVCQIKFQNKFLLRTMRRNPSRQDNVQLPDKKVPVFCVKRIKSESPLSYYGCCCYCISFFGLWKELELSRNSADNIVELKIVSRKKVFQRKEYLGCCYCFLNASFCSALSFISNGNGFLLLFQLTVLDKTRGS